MLFTLRTNFVTKQHMYKNARALRYFILFVFLRIKRTDSRLDEKT